MQAKEIDSSTVGDSRYEQPGETAYSNRKERILSLCLLIVSGIWFFNGYFLTTVALEHPIWVGLCTGVVCAILIYGVEKVIVLSVNGGSGLWWFRATLAFAVAIIGSAGADLTIFKRDIDKQVNVLKDKERDSLTVVINKQQSLEKNRLLLDIKEKRQLWLTQQANYRAEISGKTGRPGVDKIARAEEELANNLKADAIKADSILSVFMHTYEKEKQEILRKARANFNDGLLLRLGLLHKIISADLFAAIFAGAITFFFLSIELLTVTVKRLLPKSASELREEVAEFMARERSDRMMSGA